jgi:DNA-binding response OmpR family regulator
MSTLVIIAEDNLFLRPKLEMSLSRAGYEVRTVSTLDALDEALDEGAAAIFVNVGSTRLPWPEIVGRARSRGGDEFPVLGYGPHVDKELFDKGVEQGCSKVLPNGLVAADAAKVLRQHHVSA